MNGAHIAIYVGALMTTIGAALVVYLAIQHRQNPKPVRIPVRTRNAGVALLCIGAIFLLVGAMI